MQKLLDEYFVDSSRREAKAFPLNALVTRLFTADNFRNAVAPKLINLIKRNETNIDIVA